MTMMKHQPVAHSQKPQYGTINMRQRSRLGCGLERDQTPEYAKWLEVDDEGVDMHPTAKKEQYILTEV